MEEINLKPKHRKLKIFGIIFGIIILVLVSISAISYYKYNSDFKEEQLVNTIKKQVEQQTGETITVVDAKVPDSSIKNPLTNVNPRHSYLNSSDSEVAYITHTGDIGGLGNLTFNTTASGGGYGFFAYIGSLANRITKGWFIDIDASGTVNATNVNATSIYQQGDIVLTSESDPLAYNGTLAYNSSLGNYRELINNLFTDDVYFGTVGTGVNVNFESDTIGKNMVWDLDNAILYFNGAGIAGASLGSCIGDISQWTNDVGYITTVNGTNLNILKLNATNVTANYFIGSGQYLTGISGMNYTNLALTNQSNNFNGGINATNFTTSGFTINNNINGTGNITTIDTVNTGNLILRPTNGTLMTVRTGAIIQNISSVIFGNRSVPIFHTYTYYSLGTPYYSNVFVGPYTGNYSAMNTQYGGNLVFGSESGGKITSGFYNLIMGNRAGYALTSGNSNGLFGTFAGGQMTTGSGNFFLGREAGYSTQAGNNNVGIGAYALAGFENGTYFGTGNTAIGGFSGYRTYGASNVFIGYYAGARQNGNSNVLIFDNRDRGNSSNESSQAIIYGQMALNPAVQNLTINANTRINGNLNITGNLSALGVQGLTYSYSMLNSSSNQCWMNFTGGILFYSNC